MMNDTGLRRILPDQSSGSGHTFGTPRHPSIIDPILSKRVCFYKSGDPQFNGLRMVINNRTFKTFDALLDSLSKKVPLPFGVRNITTPRGVHAIYTLDELEDGKSYICSDSRKVKPIDLALARKKPPPWYHTRPVSSHRRTVQQARFFPGQNIHKELVFVRTPRRLLVFRNGDPTVKHSVVLHKRTTPTFESILEYISELIQFHVVKLHTPDGRRVDGLPGLILCSGTVVAAGREPFRPANYNAQKSPAPTMLPINRMGLRRLKALNRKKKSRSYTSKSRNFSPSSEKYIVNQIHNSIAEGSCDLPSNPTNSVELDSGRILESVAETECLLPTEDDIEKSFRVNQDGSMTVEMRVRLTIKEEETIHWTTTLKRSSVANQLNATCLPEHESGQEIGSLKSNSLDLQSPAASIDTINKDKTEDNNDEDPPSLGNGAFSESSNEEDNIKVQMDVVSPRRAPTPGHKQIRKKQPSMESIKSVTAGMVGSYSYREQTEDGAMTDQYYMVKQSSTRPVPKPRRLGSVDANNINSRNLSTFKTAGMTEILQIESREEATETVLHIYEQHTCQDNFLANLCAQGMSASGVPLCRPATSDTGQLSSNNEFEPELWRPSTASESISIWRAESMSLTSDLTLPSLQTGASQGSNAQQRFPKPTQGKDKPRQREVDKYKRVSSKPKVINKRACRLMSPGKRKNENSAEATEKRKKVKTFSSAGFIKKIYGTKIKLAKSMMKLKKGPTQNGDGGVTPKSSQQSDDTIKCILKDPNIPSALKENTSETVSFEKSRLNVAPNEVSQPRGTLTRQTSMHQEKNNTNESYDVSESLSLPAFISSSSVTKEYVAHWLEKANLNPTAHPDEESKTLEAKAVARVQTENGRCGESENKNGLMIVAEEVKYLEETSEKQTCQTLKTDLLPENVQGASVKQKIQSFENKSSQSTEKTTVNQQIVHSHTTTTNTENYTSLAQNNIEEITHLSNHICSEIISPTNKTSTEMPSSSEVENKSSPIKISLQKATPSNTLSMELPPPPPPAENTDLSNSEYCVMDLSSVASSPLYRLSSVSSQMSDNHPLSISPTSDKAISPTDHTMEMTTSVQTDIPSTLGEAPLPRTPSIKRAPLVSNLSLDRKMSLRKARLDKYTLCSDATSETTTSPTPINIAGDNVLPNGICSTGTQQPSETPPEEIQHSNSIFDLGNSLTCCTSTSPNSSTSEERMSSASISSNETPTPSDLPFKETKMNKTQFLTQKEASSPKALVKKVKLMSSPSPERKSQTKKLSIEHPHNFSKLPSLHNHPPDKTMLPNIGTRKHATPNASPSTERKLYKPKLQKRPSPYSQSLDMVSPPVRHKSSRKLLSRNLSSDNASEPTTKTQRKTSSERKGHQTPHSIKSAAELDRTLTCNTLVPLGADQSDDNKVNKTDDLITASQENSMTETQIMPQPLNIANQPNMKPVLEEIYYSIKSIRQITQNKRPSCLEKSNSLPDFSSHVASTFGSSTKALLAFLSVMTLKEGITNLNMDVLNANNVSCAEALKMIDSLREIASIEDSHKLKVSLSDLQQSASKQLLRSWKGFQELKSRSSTPNDSQQELVAEASPEKECGIDENVIDEIMDNLDIPEKLKDELASLSVGVKSDSDDKEKMSARIIEKVELSPKDHSNAKISHFSTEDGVNVRDVTQDEKANVDVSSIIKKFTDITQPKQSSTGSIAETAKHKPTDQATKDKDSQYGQNGVAKCPPTEPNEPKQIPEERQLYSTVLFVKENREGMQSCMDAVNQENQGEKKQQQGHNEDKSNEEKANLNRVVNSKKNLEQESCTSEVEEQDMEGNQLQMHSEESMSIPDNELTHDDESGSEQEGQNMSSANKDLEQKVSCERSVSSSEGGEQHSSEEEPEVECEEIQQESRESDSLSNPESYSEEEEDKQPNSNNDVELNVRGKERISSPDSQNKSLSEEEAECKELSNKDALSNPTSPSNSEKEQQSQAGCMGVNVSVDKSTCNSDVDEPSSEEEQPEVECKELKVIIEESLSGNEEEQESMGEEEHLDDLPDQTKKCKELKALIEDTEEDQVSSDDEDHHADKTQICDKTRSQNTVEGDLSCLIENQDSYIKKDNSSLIMSDSLTKRYRFNADEDSGNDHSSCEEHVEVEQPKVEGEQITSSIEEELSNYEKEFSSGEEDVNIDRYIKESCTEYQEAPALATQPEVTKCEKVVEKLKYRSEEIVSQSVAERVILLEKQVADAQKRKNTTESSPKRRFSQRNVCLELDVEDSPSELPTSQSALSTRSAPQSSLSFSYDSSGVITSEPEGNRVRSIREMFLAKSATDIQPGHRRFPSPNASDLSELRAETSASGGYQSQISSELSSGEDDSARKSITKGFVRRTIERLYGKKDANPDEEASERPPSAPKQKKKEHSSIFSPFHKAGSKAMSELSYFNSANALDTLSEATRCVAFNAQVGPKDSVPIDNGQWLLGGNTLIRKSVSDPVGINKTFTNSPQGEGMCEDTEENTPYSLFSTTSELEDKKSFSRKCTYFSLPHASDSDACQDDLSIVSKSSANGDSLTDTKDNSEDTKMWAERNGTLPGIGLADFKMMDNKVHPLTELPPDGEVVVVQPGKGQGVMNRRLQEPDMLDLLYNFCGQNCPIL
ncbi:oxygen-regulated protein 1-like [Siniperca chuatsi]|uniref:oxygen-regulated protein 1-like n=1 Tax=Siniperca chuatsi TaxID=119488 RepID=UPI001CE16799|nr:oxygen-regulated protein 1-like [Siniperca chuatsi]